MPYTITNPDASLLVTLADQAIDTTSTSLSLFGRGISNYGGLVATNFVRLLQNFSNSTPPSFPIIGQLWYNTGTTKLQLWNGTAWINVGGLGSGEYSLVDIGIQGDEVGFLLYNPLAPSGSRKYRMVLRSDSTYPGQYAIELLHDDGTINDVVFHIDGPTYKAMAHTFSVSSAFEWSNNSAPSGNRRYNSTIDLSSNTAGNWLLQTLNDDFSVKNVAMRVDGLTGTVTANVFAGVATSAKWADLAERFEADCDMEPGDLVQLGGDKEITKTTNDATIDVFGIVSTQPAVMMNSDAGSDKTHPYVALAGRVPCKVVGAVRKGQRLVASEIAGVARGLDDGEMGQATTFAVFGRALVDKSDSGMGLVMAVVGAR